MSGGGFDSPNTSTIRLQRSIWLLLPNLSARYPFTGDPHSSPNAQANLAQCLCFSFSQIKLYLLTADGSSSGLNSILPKMKILDLFCFGPRVFMTSLLLHIVFNCCSRKKFEAIITNVCLFYCKIFPWPFSSRRLFWLHFSSDFFTLDYVFLCDLSCAHCFDPAWVVSNIIKKPVQRRIKN